MKLKPLNDLELIEKVIDLSRGHKLYLVGGCVRDWLMGKKSLDIDFVFDFYPENIAEKISKLYGGNFRKFENFLTIRILLGERRIDLACLRKEKYPKPCILPIVEKARTIEEDLKRRDFTANAIAISLNKENLFEVIDPFNGIRDIQNKILKTLHKNSFRDDSTRIFRAARFCARFDWQPGKDIKNQIKQAIAKNYISLLSRERIRNELLKILAEKESFPALKLLEKWKVLNTMYPGLKLRKEMDTITNSEMKLAFLVAMAENPVNFLKSLNLEKKLYNKIFFAIKPHLNKKSPYIDLDEENKNLLKILNPDKSEISFSKVMISNEDLKKIKLDRLLWSKALNKIAALQWKGKIKTKKDALNLVLKFKEDKR